jgi:hypothetical protein
MPLPDDPIPGYYYFCTVRKLVLLCTHEWSSLDCSHGFKAVFAEPPYEIRINADQVWLLDPIANEMMALAYMAKEG